ncbi:MAG: lipoate--protein ligase [Firmicutes bacterium]|nr:lipoate--protein ligase [Bacillota bacterium]
MYYYESTTTDPYENLAIEEHLFETLPAGAGLFILWQNSDAVIVGKYQNTAEEIHAAYVREHGVAVVRRMSGGGAVYHDLGGLNYTLILDEESPDDADQNAVWQQCMAPLLAVLRSYGLDAQFSGRNDILVRSPQAVMNGDGTADGWRKIAGCAQYSRGSRTLHHGCILFDTDLEKVTAALTPGEAKFVSRSDKSVAARVTTIRACLDGLRAQNPGATEEAEEEVRRAVTMEQFRRDLRQAYGTSVPYVLSAEDQEAIRRLRDEKYRTWAWNYGFRADYEVKKVRRFEAGTVQAEMTVRGGCIEEVRFSGDFFADSGNTAAGIDAIAQLEQVLRGQLLDEHLAENLPEKEYIRGVSAEDLVRMLTE